MQVVFRIFLNRNACDCYYVIQGDAIVIFPKTIEFSICKPCTSLIFGIL